VRVIEKANTTVHTSAQPVSSGALVGERPPVGAATLGRMPLVLRGSSPAAERQRREVAAAAMTQAPVTILAEAGLAAESIAAALHEGSAHGRPFEIVDCGAASADDLHTRLFGGPERTAARRKDLEPVAAGAALVRCAGGTLILSGVDELPAGVQRRLARVLRDAEIYRTDVRRAEPVTVRFVATAAPDFDDEVAAGRFRADLHRRLASRRITLAPLRDRADDIPELARAVADDLAAASGAPPLAFTPAALTALASLPWTRNVEELHGLVAELHEAVPGHPARQEDVLKQLAFGRIQSRPPRFDSLRDARTRFERDYLAAVLAHHGWRMAEAAATLGIERANLYRKVRQLGLRRPASRRS
jgi:DNA-binding NtrC family response regulator